MNSRSKLRADNKSGYPGVRWVKQAKRWTVTIAGSHIGSFKTLEDAVAARKKAEPIYLQ